MCASAVEWIVENSRVALEGARSLAEAVGARARLSAAFTDKPETTIMATKQLRDGVTMMATNTGLRFHTEDGLVADVATKWSFGDLITAYKPDSPARLTFGSRRTFLEGTELKLRATDDGVIRTTVGDERFKSASWYDGDRYSAFRSGRPSQLAWSNSCTEVKTN